MCAERHAPPVLLCTPSETECPEEQPPKPAGSAEQSGAVCEVAALRAPLLWSLLFQALRFVECAEQRAPQEGS
eukprot:12229727-Alexandrium_andersonii.AAC.1